MNPDGTDKDLAWKKVVSTSTSFFCSEFLMVYYNHRIRGKGSSLPDLKVFHE
jgi:hypothetical protein